MIELHLLRPLWLIAAVGAAVALLLVWRRRGGRSRWWQIMDRHIGQRLIQAKGSRKWLTPTNMLLALLMLLFIGMAGPSFDKQTPDGVAGKAAVIVIVANGNSMYAGDVTPNRNRFAKQKIRSLRQRMPGSQFGLIAFAASAHQVAPLSADPDFLDLYLAPLEPSLMPERRFQTSGLQQGLVLAAAMMRDATYPIDVVVMTDQLTEPERHSIAEFQQQHQVGLQVLALGTSAGGSLRFVAAPLASKQIETQMDVAQFKALQQQQIATTGVTQNDDDLRWLQAQIAQAVSSANNRDPNLAWRDSGYLLAFVAMPLALLLFRRNSWLLSVAPLLLVVMASSYSPTACAFSWDELWWSADQRGQQALNRGEVEQAAELFADPYLKGWSLYQLGDYSAAEQQFRQALAQANLTTATETHCQFYLANALAMQQQYKQALKHYGVLLSQNKGGAEAQYNAALVRERLAQTNKISANKRQVDDAGQVMLQVGAKGKVERKHHNHLEPLSYSEPELNAWLNKVSSSPAELLKTKFELQSQRKLIDEQ